MPPAAATSAGLLLVLVLLVPLGGALLALALGGRAAERLAPAVMAAGLASALAVTVLVLRTDAALVYVLGGWSPPLGIALRADGFSAAMLLTTAVVMCGIGLFAREEYRTPETTAEARLPMSFWTLWLGVWLGLNAVFVGDDLFNLFVALELLTFSAVPLVCLDGRRKTLAAALRYLLVALLGSVLYLLGAALLYGAHGTLDIVLLAERIRPGPAVWAAVVLMTVGLLAKTALFPLHMWLPPAHAGAPAAGSAVLSALVVKASFFLLVRLWVDVMPAMPGQRPAQLLGVLGVLAILHGSVLAMRQARLKLLVAYSTVAQIGYLFLIFPIVLVPPTAVGIAAWIGGMVQLVSHACAKAAMFMAAGLVARALGHDRIAGLDGIGRAMPLTVLAFALGGLSLMGLPPSGGFIAKWLLATAAVEAGQWWWALAILLGGLLTGGYLFRVLAPAIGGGMPVPAGRVQRRQELAALALALCSVLLGFVPLGSLHLLAVGRLGGPVAGLP